MFMDKKELFLEKLLKSYEAYFNIERNVKCGEVMAAARAVFHSRSEKYVLVKSAQLWAVETNEYAYFITEEIETVEDFIKIRDKIIENGMLQIKPHKEHMCSYITMFYIADSIGNDIEKEIKKYKLQKMFLFSLHGWMHFRCVGADLNRGIISTNPMGKELKQVVGKAIKV